MVIQGYSDFHLGIRGWESEATKWIACFRLDTDVSQLFPYINAVAENAIYYDKPHYISFHLGEFLCSIYGDRVTAKFFEDREQALDFVILLIDFLNEVFSKKDSLEPNPKKYRNQSVLEIFKLLPGTNCRECGFHTCMAFAAALSKGKAVPEHCSGLPKPMSVVAAYPIYDEIGNVVSTVEVEVDTVPGKLDLESQKKRVKELERVVTAITRERRKVSFEDDNDGIRVSLTGREIEVLRLVAEGFTNIEISDLLSISQHTVKSHVVHIFNKLGVNDRTQAAVWATRNRLV